jgi:hypothetical protein
MSAIVGADITSDAPRPAAVPSRGDTAGVRLPIVLVVAALADGAADADRLSPEDLARKNERGYVTGLPLFSYSTDIGFGGGARAYYYWNGTRDDERFTRTPYLHRIAVPFTDVGRSFDDASELTLSDWRPSYGGALRISWNLATIITADYGRSAEDSGLYINFGHIF